MVLNAFFNLSDNSAAQVTVYGISTSIATLLLSAAIQKYHKMQQARKQAFEAHWHCFCETLTYDRKLLFTQSWSPYKHTPAFYYLFAKTLSKADGLLRHNLTHLFDRIGGLSILLTWLASGSYQQKLATVETLTVLKVYHPVVQIRLTHLLSHRCPVLSLKCAEALMHCDEKRFFTLVLDMYQHRQDWSANYVAAIVLKKNSSLTRWLIWHIQHHFFCHGIVPTCWILLLKSQDYPEDRKRIERLLHQIISLSDTPDITLACLDVLVSLPVRQTANLVHNYLHHADSQFRHKALQLTLKLPLAQQSQILQVFLHDNCETISAQAFSLLRQHNTVSSAQKTNTSKQLSLARTPSR